MKDNGRCHRRQIQGGWAANEENAWGNRIVELKIIWQTRVKGRGWSFEWFADGWWGSKGDNEENEEGENGLCRWW